MGKKARVYLRGTVQFRMKYSLMVFKIGSTATVHVTEKGGKKVISVGFSGGWIGDGEPMEERTIFFSKGFRTMLEIWNRLLGTASIPMLEQI